MATNAWYREYGIIGTIAVIIIVSNVSVHVSVGRLRTEIAVIQEKIAQIPPPEQRAHNAKNDMEIEELKKELEKLELRVDSRVNSILDRFHSTEEGSPVSALLSDAADARPTHHDTD